MKISVWNIEAMTGYKPQTTFWMDFSIADKFGLAAVQDTYKRAFREWKSNTVYVTELAMVLNWKSWEHNSNGNVRLSELYAKLWAQTDTWCYEHLKGDDLNYYWRTTD